MAEWNVTTPIDTFERSETESVIDIVSVIHIGEPSYYRALRTHVMDRQADGFGVHYELISYDPDAPAPSGILSKIKTKVQDAKTDAVANTIVTIEQGSGFTNQFDELIFDPERALNIDIDDSEVMIHTGLISSIYELVVERAGSRKIARLAKKGPEAIDEFIFKGLKKGADKRERGEPKKKKSDSLIIDRRNEVALAGVDEALALDENAKLVLIWGLGHLAGLHAGLTDRGYQHTARQQVELAFSMPTLKRKAAESSREIARLRTKQDKTNEKLRKLQSKTN